MGINQKLKQVAIKTGLCFLLFILGSQKMVLSATHATDVRPFALETNLLYDAALVPSIGIEAKLSSRSSIHFQWEYARWKNNSRHRYWRVNGGDIAYRYWLSPTPRQSFSGHHLGVYLQTVTYDLEWGGRGYQAAKWSFGEGIEYGYSHPLNNSLLLDFSIGLGHLSGRYKVYEPEGGCYVWQRTNRLQWYGPTKAEVSLKWLLKRASKRRTPTQEGGRL